MKVLLSVLIIGLLLFSACGTLSSERQEIISFTQEALEIENKRNELMEFFSGYEFISGYETAKIDINTKKWIIDKGFLGGVPANSYAEGPLYNIEGMASLRKRLLFIDCPQSMQVIKDILNDIYSSEVELAERQLQGEGYYVGVFASGIPFFGAMLVLPEVNQHNIEFWLEEYKSWQFPTSVSTLLMEHPWVELQLLRRDVYTRWVKILQEHDIDPLEEGFTSLIKYLKK